MCTSSSPCNLCLLIFKIHIHTSIMGGNGTQIAVNCGRMASIVGSAPTASSEKQPSFHRQSLGILTKKVTLTTKMGKLVSSKPCGTPRPIFPDPS